MGVCVSVCVRGVCVGVGVVFVCVCVLYSSHSHTLQLGTEISNKRCLHGFIRSPI